MFRAPARRSISPRKVSAPAVPSGSALCSKYTVGPGPVRGTRASMDRIRRSSAAAAAAPSAARPVNSPTRFSTSPMPSTSVASTA